MIAAGTATKGAAGAQSVPAPAYPPTPRGAQVEELEGIRVADPYRWLENVASPEVRTWVAAQNAAAASYLTQLPRRAEIASRLTRSSAYAKVLTPFGGGDRLFFFENAGLENQPALYVQDRQDTPPRVLIDPNAYSRDGLIAIVDEAASPDGRYLAYSVSTQGSSWRTARVRDVRTSQDLGEELHGIKDSTLAWTRDSRGFFYIRIDSIRTTVPNPLAPDGRQRLFYHRAGRPQSEDQLVYENPDHPDWRLRADVSEDGQYLVIALRARNETRNRLYFVDLDNPRRPNLSAPIVKLFDTADALYDFVASEGPLFFIRTSRNAPRMRVVAVDINTPDEKHWTTALRETYDPLIAAWRVDDRLVAHRLHDAHSALELFSLDGGPRGTIPLPGVGTVTALAGRPQSREIYFTYTSFLQPPVVYRFDLDTRSVVPFRDTRADSALAPYETTQLFFTSKDGTRVPMFITAARGITLTGTHPTLLEATGAFGLSATPRFSALVSTWLQNGGIYAVANVRGGGEYGRLWHDAGRGPRKQTSVDDLIAAAEFLVNQRYTRPSSLGLIGSDFGGLVAGALIAQRPELVGAAAIDGGLLDLVRYPRFTVGWTWASELGRPDDAAEARSLAALSPVHAVRAGTRYPATLLTAADLDDVIPPLHSYKFAAALQWAQAASAPILLQSAPDIGHGPAVPTARRLAIDAERLTFLIDALRPH